MARKTVTDGTTQEIVAQNVRAHRSRYGLFINGNVKSAETERLTSSLFRGRMSYIEDNLCRLRLIFTEDVVHLRGPSLRRSTHAGKGGRETGCPASAQFQRLDSVSEPRLSDAILTLERVVRRRDSQPHNKTAPRLDTASSERWGSDVASTLGAVLL